MADSPRNMMRGWTGTLGEWKDMVSWDVHQCVVWNIPLPVETLPYADGGIGLNALADGMVSSQQIASIRQCVGRGVHTTLLQWMMGQSRRRSPAPRHRARSRHQIDSRSKARVRPVANQRGFRHSSHCMVLQDEAGPEPSGDASPQYHQPVTVQMSGNDDLWMRFADHCSMTAFRHCLTRNSPGVIQVIAAASASESRLHGAVVQNTRFSAHRPGFLFGYLSNARIDSERECRRGCPSPQRAVVQAQHASGAGERLVAGHDRLPVGYVMERPCSPRPRLQVVCDLDALSPQSRAARCQPFICDEIAAGINSHVLRRTRPVPVW